MCERRPCGRAVFGLLVAMLVVRARVVAEQPGPELHPLQIHMGHWLRGSGEWRSPNPNYDPESSNRRGSSFQTFGVHWSWDAEQKSMLGEITGIRADGSHVKLWAMYAFYNPVTERVVFNQTGRNGAFISAESPVRVEPLEYGEVERFEAIQYSPTGQVKLTRHDNVFHEDGTQLSRVYEREEQGEWKLVNQRTWRLTRTSERK